MPKPRIEPPMSFVVEGGTFPFGPFRPDTPEAVWAAAGVAANLLSHMEVEGGSKRSYARKAGVDFAVLRRIATGANLPDLTSISKLELAMDVELWVPYRERQEWKVARQSQP